MNFDIKENEGFGRRLVGGDLRQSKRSDLDEIAKLFVEQGLLVIENQEVDTLSFARLCASVGALCNVPFDPFTFQPEDNTLPEVVQESLGLRVPVQRVTGEKVAGHRTGIFSQGQLLWHSAFTNPRCPLGVGLQAIRGCEGTQTRWMYSPRAYEELSEVMKARIESLEGQFRHNGNRWAPGLGEEEQEIMREHYEKEPPYTMPLVQENPGGQTGLYLFYLNDASCEKDPEALEHLVEHCFQEKYIYTHNWKAGDIVLSDQVITMHCRSLGPGASKGDLESRLLHRYTFYYDNAIKKTSRSSWKKYRGQIVKEELKV